MDAPLGGVGMHGYTVAVGCRLLEANGLELPCVTRQALEPVRQSRRLPGQ